MIKPIHQSAIYKALWALSGTTAMLCFLVTPLRAQGNSGNAPGHGGNPPAAAAAPDPPDPPAHKPGDPKPPKSVGAPPTAPHQPGDPNQHPEVDQSVHAKDHPNKPQIQIATPPKGGKAVARTHITDPQTMKLLLIGTDGTEPEFGAAQAFLDQIGIPYDTFLSSCRLSSTPCSMPVFSPSAGHANYYGIVLTIGNLAWCNSSGICQSTFSAADWAALDNFTAAFGVRTLSLYTWPEPRYGLSYAGVSASPTTAAPVNVTIPATGTSVFPTLVSSSKIPVANAYMYFATTVAATGETTTPVLQATYNGGTYTVGALHTAATGQQYLALTMDHNAYLTHSLVLNYSLFNWVTKGIFLGAKKIYFSPQVDDFFIPDDLFDATVPQCVPGGFLIDPTTDLSDYCDTVRVGGHGLQILYNWQSALNLKTQTAKFRVSLAFNGLGADPNGDMPANDTLVPKAKSLAKYFYWMSHTYDHENFDCYNAVPNSGVCPEATYAQSDFEIAQNAAIANETQLKLGSGGTYDTQSMVTPEVSGLANPNFIAAAYADGLRYLVSDASKPGQMPPSANTGIPNALNSGILEIPRYATNIFYNVDDAATGVTGSEPDEYDHFYGPNGISKQPNGQPWFSTTQSYAQIIDTESNNLLMNMLRGYAFPSMYHQSNLVDYGNGSSLLIDVLKATINKFEAYSNLPIISQSEAAIGQLLQGRATYNASGVSATWIPSGASGTGTTTGTITVTVSNPAVIDMTGVNCPTSGATCETYGGQTIVHINMPNGTPTFTVTSPL